MRGHTTGEGAGVSTRKGRPQGSLRKDLKKFLRISLKFHMKSLGNERPHHRRGGGRLDPQEARDAVRVA